MTEKLRAGIVGLGRIASGFDSDPLRKQVSTHAGAYRRIGETELVAACDVDSLKLKEFGDKWGVKNLYADYKEMFKKEKLDMVSICTWPASHFEVAREAVRRRIKAIFCEKPITDNLKTADRLVKLCREKGVILAVNHSRRWDTFHQEVKKFISDGKLGTIQTVSAYYTAGISNTGTHLLDMLRFLLGDVVWVWATYDGKVGDKDPSIHGAMFFKQGFMVHLHALDVKNYLIFEIDIYGSKGRLRITNSGFGMDYWEVATSPFFTGYSELKKSNGPFPLRDKEMMLNAVRDLTSCVSDKREPVSAGEDGLKALELICALYESAQKEKAVCLPLRNRNKRI